MSQLLSQIQIQWSSLLPGPAAKSHTLWLSLVVIAATMLVGSFVLKAVSGSAKPFWHNGLALLTAILISVLGMAVGATWLAPNLPAGMRGYGVSLCGMLGFFAISWPLLHYWLTAAWRPLAYGCALAAAAVFASTWLASFLLKTYA